MVDEHSEALTYGVLLGLLSGKALVTEIASISQNV